MEDKKLETLKNKNIEHCKKIALQLEKYVNGEVYKCSECEEAFTDNNLFCPNCHTPVDLIEGAHEQLSIYDYFSDVYDIEYIVNSQKEYKSIRLMVAYGGPDIYIDTDIKKVELYWWSDYAEYPLKNEVCELIDNFGEEIYSC